MLNNEARALLVLLGSRPEAAAQFRLVANNKAGRVCMTATLSVELDTVCPDGMDNMALENGVQVQHLGDLSIIELEPEFVRELGSSVLGDCRATVMADDAIKRAQGRKQ